ncbi:MAG: AMP-binding protein, partial [Thermoplasmata archaeon]
MLEPNEEYHDLATLVRSKAQKNGSRVALGFPGRKLTYLELDTLSERVAAGLAAEGIGRGDRVAAFLVNRPEFPLLWFGLAKLGGVLVPLNTALKGDLLAYELADAQVRGMVTERGLWETFSQVRNRVSVPHVWMVDDPSGSMRVPEDTAPWSSLQDAPGTRTSYVPQPADPASILYTSGTTGPPK